MDEKLKNQIGEMEPQLIRYRRDFHQYPEPGWTEFRTTSKLIHILKELGYEIHFGAEVIAEDAMMGVPAASQLEEEVERAIAQGADPALVAQMAGGKTGLVAQLHCGAGPTTALRFDIDSNDIEEAKTSDHRPTREGFASKNPGAMHACGHDGHMTLGLGVATILAGLQAQLHGTIRFIFQPGEEGVRGARAMVEAGVVDDVDYIIGGHLGCTAGGTGNLVAAATDFLATTKLDVRFSGEAAHAGAAPQEGKNALLAAASAALHLHGISRHGAGSSRINVGILKAGQGRNIIPPDAYLMLETRGETSEIDAYMLSEAERMIAASAASFDVAYELKQAGGTCGGECDPELAQIIAEEGKKMSQFEQVIPTRSIGGAEDFAYMMKRVQEHGGRGCYYLLGTDRPAGHHHHYFDFDEDVLSTGVELLVRTILRLNGKN